MDRQLTLRQRALPLITILAGVLLTVIGIRYLISPHAAARTFGVPAHPVGFELHYATGLRNIWLGAMALGCVALQQWRALALWFAIGSIVCFGDAAIAASSAGRWPHIAFHVGCGLGCIALCVAAWARARQDP